MRPARAATILMAALAVTPVIPARAASPAPPIEPVVRAAASTFFLGDDSLQPGGTDTLVISRGQGLWFENYDSARHNLTAVAGASVFSSATVTVSDSLQRRAPVEVVGVRDLAPGRYLFGCSIHDAMRGALVVQ